VPFVAHGNGTSLSRGSTPIQDDVVIALNRLNLILRLDPEERLAVVEPGVVNLEVSRRAAPCSLYYAPDRRIRPVLRFGWAV
jgi:glycolate oxidase